MVPSRVTGQYVEEKKIHLFRRGIRFAVAHPGHFGLVES